MAKKLNTGIIVGIIILLFLIISSGFKGEGKEETIGVNLYDNYGNLIISERQLQARRAIVGGIKDVGYLSLVINLKNDGDYSLDTSVVFRGEQALADAFTKVVPSHFRLEIGQGVAYATEKIDVNKLHEGSNLIIAEVSGLYTDDQGYVQEIRTRFERRIHVIHEEKEASIDVGIVNPIAECITTDDCKAQTKNCAFVCIHGQCEIMPQPRPPVESDPKECVWKDFPICGWECPIIVIPLPGVTPEPIPPSIAEECRRIGGYCVGSFTSCEEGYQTWGSCDTDPFSRCCVPSKIY